MLINNKFIWSLAAIVLLLAATLVATNLLGIFDSRQAPPSKATVSAAAEQSNTAKQTSAPTNSRLDNSRFGRLAWFGTKPVEPVVVPEPVIEAPKTLEELPETSLDWKIEGIFTSNIPKRASAVLSANGKPSRLYFVGEAIDDNRTLDSVENGAIVINNNGERESLYLYDDKNMRVARNTAKSIAMQKQSLEKSRDLEAHRAARVNRNNTKKIPLHERMSALLATGGEE